MILSFPQVQALMRQVGFPESEIVKGAAVFKQESSFKTDAVGTIAVGREYSIGIAQINTLAHKNYSPEQLKDPVINLTEALRIYKNDKDRNGNLKLWKSWGGYTDGGYKKYLAESQAAYGKPAKVEIVTDNDEPKNDGNKTAAFSAGGLLIGGLLLILLLD